VRGLFGNGTLETGSLRPPPAAAPPEPLAAQSTQHPLRWVRVSSVTVNGDFR